MWWGMPECGATVASCAWGESLHQSVYPFNNSREKKNGGAMWLGMPECTVNVSCLVWSEFRLVCTSTISVF